MKAARFSLATDIALFTIRDGTLHTLLIERGIEPFKGDLALPGGFVLAKESLDECATRELREETGLSDIYLEQLYTFGHPDRDPRERVISVAYFALVPSDGLSLEAGSDAKNATWLPVKALPQLAFDHNEIVRVAYQRIKAKMEYSTLGLQFMPDKFTLSELQSVYEIIDDEPRDKRNFRKWILSLGVLQETGEQRAEGAHRPAKLYRPLSPGTVEIIK